MYDAIPPETGDSLIDNAEVSVLNDTGSEQEIDLISKVESLDESEDQQDKIVGEVNDESDSSGNDQHRDINDDSDISDDTGNVNQDSIDEVSAANDVDDVEIDYTEETELKTVNSDGEDSHVEIAKPAEPQLRRSVRTTAGKHTNPHRLPKSVNQHELGVQNVKVTDQSLADLSHAHKLLVEMFAKRM